MDTYFGAAPSRKRPPRGDADDAAIAAARLLATAGRMQSRLRRIARRQQLDPRVFRFLLLFAEYNGPLRIADVAENMGVSHQTASRVANRALAARLVHVVDLSAIDGREFSVRLTVAGRHATSRSLDALRRDATEVAAQSNSPHRGWSGAYGIRWYLRNAGPMDEGSTRYDAGA